MSLCTKEEIKAHAGIAGTTFDSMFDQMILQVESVIEDETGVRTFDGTGNDEAVSNEIIDGVDDTVLRVKFYPVTEVTKVETRNSSFGWDEYTQESLSNMELDDRERIHTQYVVAGEGERNVRVSYTCGYETDDVPKDLNMCAILMVLTLFTQRNAQGLVSQDVLGLNIELSEADSLYIERTLVKYKQVTVY